MSNAPSGPDSSTGQIPTPSESIDGTSRVQRITRRKLVQTGGALALAGGAMSLPTILRRSSAQSEPLTFWQFYSPGGTVGPQDQWFQTLVKAWNDTNEVQIRLEFVPTPAENYYQKVATAFAGGAGPDIFILSPSDFLRYANGNALVDLTPYMDAAAQADFYEGVMRSRMVDGKIYALPMEVEPQAIYYDIDAFEEAGLSDADIPQTWEQLLSVAEQLTTEDRYGILFETNPGPYQVFMWSPFMWMGGGDIFTPDGKHSSFNHAGTVQALKFWQDAINSGVAPRSALGGSSGDAAANLGVRYCAMQNVGIWAIAQLNNNAPDLNYGLFKMPLPPGGTYTTNTGGWAFVANAQGKNPEVAAQFVVWAIGSMSDDSIQRVVDWCTVAKSDMPPRQSVLEKAQAAGAYAEGPLQVFAEQILPGARGESRTPPELVQLTTDAIQACQLNGADPQQTADETHQKIEAFFASYTGAPIL